MHRFENPLIRGKFIKRYKRFFVDAELDDGTIVTAHCANTGSMKGLLETDYFAWMSPNTNPKAKLNYRLEMIETPTSLVGVNTSLPNKLGESAILNQKIKELHTYSYVKREVKYGTNSRIDLLLTGYNQPDCYVEIKNVTLREDGAALFPDAVTERGTKHLRELMDMVNQGHKAAMLFIVQREDCKVFKPADKIDPTYGKTLREAKDAGVDVLCYACTLSPEKIEVAKPLEIEL